MTIDQFQDLLSVMLAVETPDHLTNLVLMGCTRPHDGIISVPVPRSDALAIVDAVDAGVATNASAAEVAGVLREQLTSTVE